jgi:putative membrane protein
MRRTLYFTSLSGLALFIILIIREGIPDILASLSVAGWGLVWIALYRVVPIVLDALGWSVMFHKDKTPSIFVLSWARWVGEAINTLLPVAQVGGNVVRAKIVNRYGISATRAGAIAVVDLTNGLTTQCVFALFGASLLLIQGGEKTNVAVLVTGLLIGVFVLSMFYITQRLGLFTYVARVLQTLSRRKEFMSFVGGAKSLDQKINDIYKKNHEILISSFWRLLAWVTRTGETWLALYFLGFPVNVQDALIIESLSSAVRVSAFFIPGALGVQEGGILIICSFLGVNSEIAIALALVKRVRELLVGIPGLVSWSISERHHV